VGGKPSEVRGTRRRGKEVDTSKKFVVRSRVRTPEIKKGEGIGGGGARDEGEGGHTCRRKKSFVVLGRRAGCGGHGGRFDVRKKEKAV